MSLIDWSPVSLWHLFNVEFFTHEVFYSFLRVSTADSNLLSPFSFVFFEAAATTLADAADVYGSASLASFPS